MSSYPIARRFGAVTEPLEGRRLLSAELSATFAADLPTILPTAGDHRVQIDITNQGDAPARGPIRVDLYASTDSSLDSGDVLLAKGTRLLRLNPDNASNIELQFASPPALPDGNYYLLTKISPTGAKSASGGVFASSAPITFQQPFVDLAVQFVQTPNQPFTTDGIRSNVQQATVQLANEGNIAARGTVGVNLYLSSSDVLDSSATLAGQVSALPVDLAPGASRVLPVRVRLPYETMPGSYKLFAVATPIRGIVQRDDLNVVAAADRLQVVSSVPQDVLGENYLRHRHRCYFYDGQDYCADDSAVYGIDEIVVAGDSIPPTYSPSPTPEVPASEPSTQSTPGPSTSPPDDATTEPSSDPATQPSTSPSNSAPPDTAPADPTSAPASDPGDSGGDSAGSGDDSGGSTDDSGSSDSSGDTGDDGSDTTD